MIQLALRMYHVPEVIQVMLDDYFSRFRIRFATNSYTTNWINLEVGIAMGCTISPILFAMAMEVTLKAAEGSAGPADLGDGCSMPPLKAFMDDTTIICSKEDETRRYGACISCLFSNFYGLLVYDICPSTVEAIEAKINKYTRKWLGVPPGLSDVSMYCRKAKLKLPMKSILEEYKCGKARLLIMLEESMIPWSKPSSHP
ncbi:reverse transcriptase [Plakobranchus ocellatus]|uniref:Reverse transcriptase n=1 Tax=Plakobranchus ocellatus TaxID=259542 RepID=A0AAV3XSH1_9GAST|nr:reverse transcriptase [Plakobranchus ocellatus]